MSASVSCTRAFSHARKQNKHTGPRGDVNLHKIIVFSYFHLVGLLLILESDLYSCWILY